MPEILNLLGGYLIEHLTLRTPSKEKELVSYMGLCRIDSDVPARRIDIRIVPEAEWAAALLHFTGSGKSNILLRKRAIELGMFLSQEGLFYSKGGRRIPTETEQDIYAELELKYLPPAARTKNISTLPLLSRR